MKRISRFITSIICLLTICFCFSCAATKVNEKYFDVDFVKEPTEEQIEQANTLAAKFNTKLEQLFGFTLPIGNTAPSFMSESDYITDFESIIGKGLIAEGSLKLSSNIEESTGTIKGSTCIDNSKPGNAKYYGEAKINSSSNNAFSFKQEIYADNEISFVKANRTDTSFENEERKTSIKVYISPKDLYNYFSTLDKKTIDELSSSSIKDDLPELTTASLEYFENYYDTVMLNGEDGTKVYALLAPVMIFGYANESLGAFLVFDFAKPQISKDGKMVKYSPQHLPEDFPFAFSKNSEFIISVDDEGYISMFIDYKLTGTYEIYDYNFALRTNVKTKASKPKKSGYDNIAEAQIEALLNGTELKYPEISG